MITITPFGYDEVTITSLTSLGRETFTIQSLASAKLCI